MHQESLNYRDPELFQLFPNPHLSCYLQNSHTFPVSQTIDSRCAELSSTQQKGRKVTSKPQCTARMCCVLRYIEFNGLFCCLWMHQLGTVFFGPVPYRMENTQVFFEDILTTKISWVRILEPNTYTLNQVQFSYTRKNQKRRPASDIGSRITECLASSLSY